MLQTLNEAHKVLRLQNHRNVLQRNGSYLKNHHINFAID